MARAYYNEHDPFAAAWLRNLIAADLIAPGDVDERDILDVTPGDLRNYTQCHFFAGIGGWSYALRLAGWPDGRPIWTGSCPCQPFSAAGAGAGFADERHLWPAFHWLIGKCRPGVVVGEQVASKAGRQWLDLVSADLEREGYAVGAVDLAAASVAAPHIRQRHWWCGVAHNQRDGRRRITAARLHERRAGAGSGAAEERDADRALGDDVDGCGVVDERVAHTTARGLGINGSAPGDAGYVDERDAVDGGLAHPPSEQRDPRRLGTTSLEPGSLIGSPRLGAVTSSAPVEGRPALAGGDRGASPHHLGWTSPDWLLCRDHKWRPVEPGTFPLAHGVPARMGRLRGYGNAIVPQVAQAFIESLMEVIDATD